ncbi:butyrophilin subfamily 1 member A1-like isoform X4 [Mugil cephalus]|uniref:butyrophilin subfamily 1 member A1-like isoform X4 n=1 Tax=Mugil cephalus TaxID=48193 RepID=UPI001FB5CEC2|nr:butyrophilin subfamily 1 member A1-like isoform X4 [Mugil cephalus]
MKEVFMYAAGSHYNNGRPGQDPYFKGRVFHFEDQLQSGNASIVIRNIKKTDSGRYSCIFPFPQPGRTRSIIELIVDCILKDRTKENKPGSCPKPSVTNLDETDDWALLQCEVQGAFPEPEVQWLDSDNNRVHDVEQQVTQSEGKFNIILNATVKKSDVYRCVSTQEEICHQVDQKIKVTLQGAALNPVITHHEAKEGMLLQCEVRGASPKPKLVWKDGAGNILPADKPKDKGDKGIYSVILKATVTKTDNYRCVSTQEEIHHEVILRHMCLFLNQTLD